MSAVQCFFLQSKVCPHQKVQTTGDSDDLGAGTVLMVAYLRCSDVFKCGVPVAHILEVLPGILEIWVDTKSCV